MLPVLVSGGACAQSNDSSGPPAIERQIAGLRSADPRVRLRSIPAVADFVPESDEAVAALTQLFISERRAALHPIISGGVWLEEE